MTMWNENQQLNAIDILSVLSFIIAIQNLDENRAQSAHNDVQVANAKQEQHLLQEIKKMFEEQNKMLNEILDLLKNQTTT